MYHIDAPLPPLVQKFVDSAPHIFALTVGAAGTGKVGLPMSRVDSDTLVRSLVQNAFLEFRRRPREIDFTFNGRDSQASGMHFGGWEMPTTLPFLPDKAS